MTTDKKKKCDRSEHSNVGTRHMREGAHDIFPHHHH
jgi:hypothetical protein